MRCPLDDTQLREVTRRGVKIDICPECKGIWLDRGELDHLIEAEPEFEEERAAAGAREPERGARYGAESSRRSRSDSDDDRGFLGRGSRRADSDDDRYYSSGSGSPPPRKKKSWLSEMFEFGE